MRENLKLLFYKDIKRLLTLETPEYLVRQTENDDFIIEEIPLMKNKNIYYLFDMLCYDFDLLTQKHQEEYKTLVKEVKKKENNLYFPKQN